MNANCDAKLYHYYYSLELHYLVHFHMTSVPPGDMAFLYNACLLGDFYRLKVKVGYWSKNEAFKKRREMVKQQLTLLPLTLCFVKLYLWSDKLIEYFNTAEQICIVNYGKLTVDAGNILPAIVMSNFGAVVMRVPHHCLQLLKNCENVKESNSSCKSILNYQNDKDQTSQLIDKPIGRSCSLFQNFQILPILLQKVLFPTIGCKTATAVYRTQGIRLLCGSVTGYHFWNCDNQLQQQGGNLCSFIIYNYQHYCFLFGISLKTTTNWQLSPLCAYMYRDQQLGDHVCSAGAPHNWLLIFHQLFHKQWFYKSTCWIARWFTILNSKWITIQFTTILNLEQFFPSGIPSRSQFGSPSRTVETNLFPI